MKFKLRLHALGKFSLELAEEKTTPANRVGGVVIKRRGSLPSNRWCLRRRWDANSGAGVTQDHVVLGVAAEDPSI